MKLKIKYLFICLVAALFTACEKDEYAPDSPQPREKVSRTVLVYLVGDNTLNELSSLLLDNFEDMKTGMELVDDSECNLVVYSEMKYDVPRFVQLKKKDGKVIADTLFTYPERNPLAKEVMAEVLNETVRLFPADSYGFVFLSHGDGWVAGTSPNSRSMGDYRGTQMNISDFHQVLKSTQCHFDFVLFDDCFMQSVEVAYELRDCVDYFIGSPTEIPGPGAPYKALVSSFFVKENTATEICSSYFNYYNERYTGAIPTNTKWTGGVSVSVIKSEALDGLALSTKNIISKYVSNKQVIELSVAMCYDKRSSTRYYHDFDGLVRFLTNGNADYLEWKAAFDAAVIQWNTTPKNYSMFASMFSMDGSAGLSTYIPRNNSQLNRFYHSYEWYTAAGWNLTGW